MPIGHVARPVVGLFVRHGCRLGGGLLFGLGVGGRYPGGVGESATDVHIRVGVLVQVGHAVSFEGGGGSARTGSAVPAQGEAMGTRQPAALFRGAGQVPPGPVSNSKCHISLA